MENKMEVHDLQQGTVEWHRFRSEHFGASDAAAMLGLSKYKTRSQLLKEKHTGITPEVTPDQQVRFDAGHETEEKGRAIMETMLELDLYPITCSRGKHSCSCDGATFDHVITFEHKLWNVELVAYVEEDKVPDTHMPQLQQILMVTGAAKIFFVVSDGTEKNFRYTMVEPSPIWFKKLQAGWHQFETDLANYEPPEVKVMPEAAPIKDLPMLQVEIKGEVVSSNMGDFRAASDARLAAVPESPTSDEDFVNTKAFIKSAIEVEARIKLVTKTMQEQNASINEVYVAMDEIGAEWRTKRLTAEKLVKREEEGRKLKIVSKGKIDFANHKAVVEKTIKPIKLVCTDAGIAIATKNKKTPESMQEAVSVALSQAMVEATTEGAEIYNKLDWARDPEGGNITAYESLFVDLQEIIQKPLADFRLVVNARIESVSKEIEKAGKEAAQVSKEPIHQGGAYLPAANAKKDTKQKVDDVLMASVRTDVFMFGNKYKDVPQLAGVLEEMQKFLKATEPATEKEPF